MASNWFKSLALILGEAELYDLLTMLSHTGLVAKGASIGLTEEETVSVYAYTMPDQLDDRCCYRAINDSLRYGLSGLEPVVDAISGALSKLPPFVGLVIRRTNLLDGVLHLSPGAVFYDKAFLSTSNNLDREMHFGRDDLSIWSVGGRDISAFSAIPGEREVLFAPSTRLCLSSIAAGPTGYSLIADEVP